MNIAYLGIDLLFPVLETVAQQGHRLLRIYTCPCDNVTEFNTRVVGFAQENGIPYTTLRIREADLQALARAGCDLLLCAGYYYRTPMTDAFPMVNIHPAPLPMCRGAWPMPQILLGAYPEGGVTMHRMARDFDTGDILLAQTFPLAPGDTLADYMRQACTHAQAMTHRLLDDLDGVLRAGKPQGEGRYLPCPTAADWTVDEAMTAEQADRVLRAFYGYECLYQRDGRCFELIGARARRGAPQGDFPLRDGFIHAPRYKEVSIWAMQP